MTARPEVDAPDFDAADLARLREVGGVKWSTFPGAIGAFVAETDFGTAPAVTRALHAAVDDGLTGYLPPPRARALSEACADFQRDVHGWDVPADDVHPLADVITALELVITHRTRPGSSVIVPTPAYMPFLTVPPALGREVLRVPATEVGGEPRLDLDGLDAAFRAGGELLVLCNPANPLGRVLRREELREVCALVERHGGQVFADEIHAPVVYPGHRHVPYASVSAAAAGHTLTATSTSKAWNLPGLKCAQVVLTRDADRELWQRIGRVVAHGASTLGVVASTAAYRDGREWLAALLTHLDGNRRLLAELLAEHLPAVGYTPPEGTYVGWLDCRALGLEPDAAAFFAAHAGVVLTDGEACGAPGFARLVFATPRPVLTQLVRQLGRAVREEGAAGR